jgi:hypothetical protein
VSTTTQAEDFFAGFHWAVRTAFAGPVGACRFEQGDILHDSELAYALPWEQAKPGPGASVLVKSPMRGPASKSEKDAESLFQDNWGQAVTLEFTDHRAHATRELTSTQGRLYTLLWKGDASVLAPDSPAPPLPGLARGVLKQLAATVPHFRAHLKGKAARAVVFLMPLDRTNDLLMLKHAAVAEALREPFAATRLLASPAEAGLASDTGFVPTLSIACYAVTSAGLEAVEGALKQALYNPTRDKKTDREVFRISAHGHLQAL